MRNLRNIKYDVCELPADITASCWDAAKDELLVATGPTEDEAKITLFRVVEDPHTFKLDAEQIASWDAPSPNPDLPTDRIVSLHHFSDSATTCLVLEGGDIITVAESPSSPAHIEITGSIDAGISAARWSPDSELLLLFTKLHSVVLMSRAFDGVAETELSAADLALSRHVSVGWGKKETQFHGKGAKAKARDALRDPTVPESVDDGKRAANDDGVAVEISWRGDGAYVAVNAAVPEGERRAVRVYTREGVLDSVSEPVDGLESGLSWRPAGNLLACVQRFGDQKADVVFFERNGLRHGQFELRFPDGVANPERQIKLEWNSDSTVLAVKYANFVQLWTMGNYHWYLKQEIRTGPGLSGLTWHPEKALQLGTVASGQVLSMEYIFNTARGSMAAPNDHGAVAVIDGKTVKVTPLRTANVPPPMALFELTATATVVDVAFSSANSSMVVLNRSGADIYSWETRDGRSVKPKFLKTLDLDQLQLAPEPPTALQICFSGDGRLHILFHSDETSVASVAVNLESGERKLQDTCSVAPGSIMGAEADGDDVRLQSRNGKLSKLTGDSAREAIKFPTQLPWMEMATIDDELIAFGLSRGGQLHANDRLLTKGCTSFLLTPDHLILTTSNHFLKFVHLTRVDDLQVPADDPETDERCRSIERGAKLVTAMPTNMNLVLQMPRGNLETIFPRAMVLAGIRRLIEDRNYARAFSYCRTQRVDMNILYDHKPEQFLSNVGHFLDQLKDASYIDLFLSSLKAEDVSQTMYKDTRPAKTTMVYPFGNAVVAAPIMKPQAPKVNTICHAVLKSLKARKNANLQNIITAHVCKDPPALDDGLLVVAEMMQEDERLAERAVEHICFLVDVNRLYDHALGLYNLDLSLLVAQQSQRDPREYLPFVQNLHKMPDLRRKFTIDDHLGHRSKALAHLQALNSFDEVRSYTTKHNLYQTALSIYRYDGTHHRILTDLFASYLESNSKHREAALAYESLGNFPRAASNYKSAGPSSWRECLFAASQQTPPLSPSALSDLASSLAEALVEAKDYPSAATIHLEYLQSPESAIRLLCRGYLFADAMRVAALASRPDLLASAVDPGLGDALSSTTEFLADCKAQLKAQVPRVLELRAKAAEDPLAFYEGERAGGDVPDDVSVAASSRLSTSASLFTRYTGKTGTGTLASNTSKYSSKMRKREEKKRARGRKGTVYEEEYLVNSVRRLVERVESGKAEVERLVFGLVRRGMLERGRAVEALLGEVIVRCREAIGEVWPGKVEEKKKVEGGEGEGEGEADEAMLEAARKMAEPPVVSDFAKMSLLG